ncbi:MAG: response regulator, partial [Bacteroidetes bacterium]|nr:response regulator [Bacteroidota bacterium]
NKENIEKTLFLEGISSENLEQCLISLVDITTMKKVEQELIIATKKAEESDRLKSAFLANMSHEIRTPMNAIMGFSQLLNEDGIEPDEKKEFANIINKSGTHLLSLINDILEVAKIDSNQLKVTPTPFNLNRLIDELNLLYAREKEEKNKNHINLIITKSLKNENCNIFTDEVRLRQIFINLLSNALKFTNDGLIHFGYETKNDHILFFVKDTGKGIAKKNQEFIFERFRQEDDGNTRQYGGSGLGLSISKGLINIMDGTIWVESEENVGSTFYFTLPSSIITKEPIFSPKKINPAKVYNFEGKTVLIAEDVDDNMLLIRRNLRKTKATVIEVKNGVDAVKFCQENIQIDLVLMDILMPVMDGLDAAIEIRKTKPYLPIIAISAYAFDDDKDKSMNAGCNGFVTKPLNWTLLLEMIEGYLNK